MEFNEVQRRMKDAKEGIFFAKLCSKIENVVSQSSGGVVRATGCFYDSEIMFPND